MSPAAPTGLCARVSERPRLRAVDSERFLKGMGQGTGMAINMGGAACFPVLPLDLPGASDGSGFGMQTLKL